MRVYVESNFTLEMALQQSGVASCEALIDLAADEKIEVAIPAFSIMEPHSTIERRGRDRRTLHERLKTEFDQIARSKNFRADKGRNREVIGLLIAATEQDERHLEQVRVRLETYAYIIPMDRRVLSEARSAQRDLGLDPHDAVVFASLAVDLEARPTDSSCFVTTNSKDFGTPPTMAALEKIGPKTLFKFEAALAYVRASFQ